jgi:hypothetical protein
MARSTYSRAEWYDAMKFDPRINNTISEIDEKKHSELRYKLSHGVCNTHFPGCFLIDLTTLSSIPARIYRTVKAVLTTG